MGKFDLERALELYELEQNITEAAKKHCRELGIPYEEKYRHRVSRKVNSEGFRGPDKDLETVTDTVTNQYPEPQEVNMPSAWSPEKNRFLTIEEYCETYGLDPSTVKSSKLITHNSSNITYNIAFYTPEEEVINTLEDSLDELIKKFVKPIKVKTENKQVQDEEWFDRLVYADAHINMDVNGKEGVPLYEGKWDREEILLRLSKMVGHVKQYRRSNLLVIDDLGDFMDGLGGYTTRKGHELPQQGNDKEAFELAIQFKVSLVESLLEVYDMIICNDITNDNHSGVFSYFVSSAAGKILTQKYPDSVEVNTIEKFISHYSIDKHTFLICHGKDIGEQRYGFKPRLDPVQAEKIDQYCKENNLYNGNFIEFSKGDSHQGIYDDTTSNDFYYYNYPPFSPPSNWVKTNFKNSKSGFRFYNIKRDEDIKVTIPYFFDKQKTK